ncbi:polymorphic toxin-type HINT domain-containing protein [Nonomuraea sp. NPDC059023]|uniref:polymorphic toxin-type HINT domain-containing protein n=1 Tax=unclassified Nonomuraea TaxID=2593643 RepID=UPI00369E2F75
MRRYSSWARSQLALLSLAGLVPGLLSFQVLPAVANDRVASTTSADGPIQTPRQATGTAAGLPSLTSAEATRTTAKAGMPAQEAEPPKDALPEEQREGLTRELAAVEPPCGNEQRWQWGASYAYGARVYSGGRIWATTMNIPGNLNSHPPHEDQTGWRLIGPCPPPPAPQMVSMTPANGALLLTEEPTLKIKGSTWQGATISFQFEVCDGPAMTGCVTKDVCCALDAEWKVPDGTLSWGRQYWWRVKLHDASTVGGQNSTTPIRSFTVGVRQPTITSQLATSGVSGQEFHQQAGNYTTSFTDASVPVAGPALSVVRSYNSMDTRRTGVFGAGWSTRWDMRITPENVRGREAALVTFADGREVRFADKKNGSFQPPPGLYATLAKPAEGGWRLMDKAATTYLFDAVGRLTKITDKRGRAQTLEYGADGKLAKATGTGGRSLTFTWTGAHVTSVATDPVGGAPLTWTYAYTGDVLDKVCNPANECTIYGHNPGSLYRSAVLDSDPMGYWRLNEASGTTAKDLGWGAGDARYSAAALGKPGALSGTPDTSVQVTNTAYVDLPADTVQKAGEWATLETWFKTTATGTLMRTSGPFVPAHKVMQVDAGGKLAASYEPIGSPIVSAAPVNDGNWHHAVLTIAGDTQTLYVDGQVQGTLTEQVSNTDYVTNLELGGISGQVDEAAVYDRPLSEAEVQRHFAARAEAPHKLTSITLPSGRTWAANAYDVSTDRLKTHTSQHGGTWTINEPVINRSTGMSTVTVKDPAGETITSVYDAWRGYRLVSQTDQLGKKTSYTYDTGGYLSKVVDPNNVTVQRTNDKRGNVLTTTTCRAAGNCQTQRTQYHLNTGDQFDPRNDRPIKLRDPRSASATDNTYATTIDYNTFGEQTKLTTPATPDFPQGRTVGLTYTDGSEPAVGGGTTPAGLAKSKTDPRGNAWSYRYTAAGDLVEQTSPEGLVTKLEYDAVGRLDNSTQVSAAFPDGVKTTVTYDGADRVATRTEPAVKNEVSGITHTKKTTFAYDPDGNTLSETVTDLTGGDAARSTVSTYDGQGRAETITDPEGGVVRQAWNTLGQLARVTDARGTVIENGYSKRGELTTRTLKGWTGSPVNPQPAQDVVLEAFAYDPGGRLAMQTDAMGRKTSFTYFTDNLLSKKIADDAKLNGVTTARDVVLEEHTYDAAGNQVKLVAGGGLATTEVVFDAANLITSQTFDPAKLKRKTVFTYDANGNVVKTSRSGAGSTRAESTEHVYNKDNKPTRETVENGDVDLVSTLTYDDRGLVTAMTDPRGNVAGASAADFTTTMRYDALGRLVEAVGPQVAVDKAGSSTNGKPTIRLGYDTVGATTHNTDAEGRTVTSAFDKAGRLTSQIAPSYTPPGGTAVTPTVTHTYDAAGQLIKTTDPRGNISSFEYDQLGRQVRSTDPAPAGQSAGQSVTEYSLAGQTLAKIDPTGARTEATYDDLGRAITATVVERKPSAAAYTTKLEYNDAGVLTKEIAPGNRTTGFAVNAAGEVTTQTDPATNKTVMDYDLAGRLVKTTDGEGNATVAEYDLAGRLIGAQDLNATGAMVRSASTAYDAAGNPVSATSPEGHITRQTYDALNRVTSLIEPIAAGESITTSFGYDASGARTRLTDGRGNATWTSYNTLGLAESVTEPATAAHPNLADRTWTSIYDQAGNPTASLLPGGVRIDRTFDHLNRPTAETGTGGGAATAERTFSYDLAGRATAIGDLTVDYNDRGLPLNVKKGTVQQTGYTYNELGNPSQRVDAAGTATFTWDNVGRLATAVDPVTGRTLTYGYDKSSRLKTLTGKTSAGAAADSQTFTYDAVDRLETQTLKNGAGAQLAKITYGWDKDDNLTAKTTAGTAGAGTNTYTYDHAGRLTSWTAPGGTKTDYGWDASGNRTKAGTKTFTYDERNRLTTGDGTDYTYTARGTLATETKNGQTTNLTFDAFDRLIADGESLYSYDALDRVSSRIRGAAKQTFAYSGLGNDLAAISDTFGGVQGRYGRDPSGALLGQQEGTEPAAGTLTDLHGDLVATFTGSTLTTTAAYDPFGTVTERTGAKTNLGYQGEYTDPDTGKTNMHARWYQSGTGTFTSRDTATLNPNPSVQANRYTYANASPLTGIDPTGHARESTGLDPGYAGDPCGASGSIQRCGVGATDFMLVGGSVGGGGGSVACSGAGLDKCGGFELTGITVMTEEEMKRLGHLPNGMWIEDLKGFWEGSKKIRQKIIGMAYAGKSELEILSAWAQYKLGGDMGSAGGKNVPEPSTWGMAKCKKELGAKACDAMQAAAKLARQALYFDQYCLGEGDAHNTGCNGAAVALGINNIEWEILKQARLNHIKLPDHWFNRFMISVTNFFFEDADKCVAGSFVSCALFLSNFIPGGSLAKLAGRATGKLAGLFKKFDNAFEVAAKACKHSFTPETRILMADGSYKKISEIELGERVVATDPTTGITAARAVVDVIVGQGVKGLVKIAFGDESASKPQRSTVTATDSHPFWAADSKEWVDAVDLQPGRWLRSTTGAWIRVQSVERWTAPQQVYNLSVEGIHTYYVKTEDASVLVHNCVTVDMKIVNESWRRMGFNSMPDFGDVAWGGRSKADAMKLATPEQLAKMRKLGLTKVEAEHWRNFYLNVHQKSAAKHANDPSKINPSARSRAELFQWYMDNL